MLKALGVTWNFANVRRELYPIVRELQLTQIHNIMNAYLQSGKYASRKLSHLCYNISSVGTNYCPYFLFRAQCYKWKGMSPGSYCGDYHTDTIS